MTMTEFEKTPIVVGQQATNYGEMRTNARQTRDATDETAVMMAAAGNPKLLAGAMRGLCEVVLYLIDEIEQSHQEIQTLRERVLTEFETGDSE